MSTQAFEIISGTLPVDDIGGELYEPSNKVQVGCFVTNTARLPLYAGCNIVGRAAGTGITKSQQEREQDWAVLHNKPAVHGVFVADDTVSSTHLLLEIEPDGSSCLIRDLKSLNKTRLGDNPRAKPLDPSITYSIHDKQPLLLGLCAVRVEYGNPGTIAEQEQQQEQLQDGVQQPLPQQQPAVTAVAADFSAAVECKKSTEAAAVTGQDGQQQQQQLVASPPCGAVVRSPKAMSPKPVSALQLLQRLHQQQPQQETQQQQQPTQQQDLHTQPHEPLQQQQQQEDEQDGSQPAQGSSPKQAAVNAQQLKQLLALAALLSPSATTQAPPGPSANALMPNAGGLLDQCQPQQQHEHQRVYPAAPGMSAASYVHGSPVLAAAAAALAAGRPATGTVDDTAAAAGSSAPGLQETPDSGATADASLGAAAAAPAAAAEGIREQQALTAAAEPAAASAAAEAPSALFALLQESGLLGVLQGSATAATAQPATGAAAAEQQLAKPPAAAATSPAVVAADAAAAAAALRVAAAAAAGTGFNPQVLQALFSNPQAPSVGLDHHAVMHPKNNAHSQQNTLQHHQPQQQQQPPAIESQGYTGCTASQSDIGQTQTTQGSLGREDWWADENIAAQAQELIAAYQTNKTGEAKTQGLVQATAADVPATASVAAAERPEGLQMLVGSQTVAAITAAVGRGSDDGVKGDSAVHVSAAAAATSGVNNALVGSHSFEQPQNQPQQQQQEQTDDDSRQLVLFPQGGEGAELQQQQQAESQELLLLAASQGGSEAQQQEQQLDGEQQQMPVQSIPSAKATAGPQEIAVDVVPATQDYSVLGWDGSDLAAAAAAVPNPLPATMAAAVMFPAVMFPASEAVLETQQLLPDAPVSPAAATFAMPDTLEPQAVQEQQTTAAAVDTRQDPPTSLQQPVPEIIVTDQEAAVVNAAECSQDDTESPSHDSTTAGSSSDGDDDICSSGKQQQQGLDAHDTEDEQDLVSLMLMRAAAGQQQQQDCVQHPAAAAAAGAAAAGRPDGSPGLTAGGEPSAVVGSGFLGEGGADAGCSVLQLLQTIKPTTQQQQPASCPAKPAAADPTPMTAACELFKQPIPPAATAAAPPIMSLLGGGSGSSLGSGASPLINSQQVNAAFDIAGELAGQLMGGPDSGGSAEGYQGQVSGWQQQQQRQEVQGEDGTAAGVKSGGAVAAAEVSGSGVLKASGSTRNLPRVPRFHESQQDTAANAPSVAAAAADVAQQQSPARSCLATGAAAAAAASNAPQGCSFPGIVMSSIGFGTQMAMEVLEALGKTPTSGDRAAADLRALRCSRVEGAEPLQLSFQVEQQQPSAAAGSSGRGRSGGGRRSGGRGGAATAAGSGGGSSRGRAKTRIGQLADGNAQGSDAAAAAGSGGSSRRGGSGSGRQRKGNTCIGSKRRSRSRSSTPDPAAEDTAAAAVGGGDTVAVAAAGPLRRSSRSTAGKKQLSDDYVSGIEFSQHYHAGLDDLMMHAPVLHHAAAAAAAVRGWGISGRNRGLSTLGTAAAAAAAAATAIMSQQGAGVHDGDKSAPGLAQQQQQLVQVSQQQQQQQLASLAAAAAATLGPVQQSTDGAPDDHPAAKKRRSAAAAAAAELAGVTAAATEAGADGCVAVSHGDAVLPPAAAAVTADDDPAFALQGSNAQQQQQQQVIADAKEAHGALPVASCSNIPVCTAEVSLPLDAPIMQQMLSVQQGQQQQQHGQQQQQQGQQQQQQHGQQQQQQSSGQGPTLTSPLQHHVVKKLTSRKSSAVKPPQQLAAARNATANNTAAAATAVKDAFAVSSNTVATQTGQVHCAAAAAAPANDLPAAKAVIVAAAAAAEVTSSKFPQLHITVNTAATAAVEADAATDAVTPAAATADLNGLFEPRVSQQQRQQQEGQDLSNTDPLAAAGGAVAVPQPVAGRSGRRAKSLPAADSVCVLSPAVRTPTAAAAAAGSGAGSGRSGRGRRNSSYLNSQSASPATVAAIRAAAGYTPTRSCTRRAAAMAAAAAGGSSTKVQQVVVSFASGVPADLQKSGRKLVESLGGRVSDHQTDMTVTHLVAQKGRLTRSLKLLLAVARGVPVVNFDTWIEACRRDRVFVAADEHLLDDAKVMEAYPQGASLPRSFAAAADAKAQERGLLTGVHCLLSPGLVLGNDSAKNLKLLITAAGGIVLDSPHQLLQLVQQQQQQQQQQEDGKLLLPAAAEESVSQQQCSLSPRSAQKRSRSSPIEQQQQQQRPAKKPKQQQQQQQGCTCERLLVLVSTNREDHGSDADHQSSDHNRQRSDADHHCDVIDLKDLRWARESGLAEGWPLYSREWLIGSIMTYSVDWDKLCGRV